MVGNALCLRLRSPHELITRTKHVERMGTNWVPAMPAPLCTSALNRRQILAADEGNERARRSSIGVGTTTETTVRGKKKQKNTSSSMRARGRT